MSNPVIDQHPENASTFWGPFDVFANTGRLRHRSESFAGVGNGQTLCHGEVEEGEVNGGIGQVSREQGVLIEERPQEREQWPPGSEGNGTDVPAWLVSSAFYRPQGQEDSAYGVIDQDQEQEHKDEQMKRERRMSFALQILRRRGMRISSSESVKHDQG